MQEQGGDTYERGTQAPRSSGRTAADDADDEDDGDAQDGEDDIGAGGQENDGIHNFEEDFDNTQGTKEADCIEVQLAEDGDYFDYGIDEDLDELVM
jgi:hypothetical protein